VGPLEEKDEVIDISSDVVKVKGEDPATTGCLREDRVRTHVGDSQSWVRGQRPGTVCWVLRDYLGVHHSFSPEIESDIRHPRKKERKIDRKKESVPLDSPMKKPRDRNESPMSV